MYDSDADKDKKRRVSVPEKNRWVIRRDGRNNMIKVEGVSKKYDDEWVLRNVNAEFCAGKIHGIVGMNGSGKTMLFKCICGFVRPDSGRVLVNGRQIGKDVDFPEDTGFIIETPGFLPDDTAYQNLKMLADVKRKIGGEDIKKTLEKVGLDPVSKKPVKKYSLGMRERLGIAQAIMESPKLLVLDEPFNGLDKKGVAEVYEILKELKGKGTTILLASHNEMDIQTLCDEIYEMELGVLSKI